MVFIPR